MSSDPRPVFAPARVVSTSPATDRIQRITLQRAPSRKAAPGTHVDVRVRTPKGEDVRSYSVVESNADGSLLTVSVMRAQASRGGSVFMHGLVEGDELACTQPLQNFELRPGAHRYVLLAGGVGITAVIEMGRVLHRLGQDYRFVYVGRSRAQMAYLDELAALHGDRLEVHADDEGSALDVEALVAGLPEQGRTEVYMCGPIRLMDAVRRSWLAHGRPVADLRYETFGSSGWFEPEAFEVEILHENLLHHVPINEVSLHRGNDLPNPSPSPSFNECLSFRRLGARDRLGETKNDLPFFADLPVVDMTGNEGTVEGEGEGCRSGCHQRILFAKPDLNTASGDVTVR